MQEKKLVEKISKIKKEHQEIIFNQAKELYKTHSHSDDTIEKKANYFLALNLFLLGGLWQTVRIFETKLNLILYLTLGINIIIILYTIYLISVKILNARPYEIFPEPKDIMDSYEEPKKFISEQICSFQTCFDKNSKRIKKTGDELNIIIKLTFKSIVLLILNNIAYILCP